MRGDRAQQCARKSRVYATTRATETLAVEVMAELMTKGAEERAEGGDLFPDGGPHPETDE